MIAGLLLALIAGDTPSAGDRPAACPTCGVRLATIDRSLAELHALKWRDRDRAARSLASVRWECHPDVVAALAVTLRRDGKAKVRAEAAETLGRLVPTLPTSHVALDEATRTDPDPSVRQQARKALASQGLRCVIDCPICGPLPTGAAITGPVIRWPEWSERAGPPRPPAATLPPALPD